MSTAARLALEYLLVARGRLAMISACYRPEKGCFWRGGIVSAVTRHAERVKQLEVELAATPDGGAMTDERRKMAVQVARARLGWDKRVGRCLCNLPKCGHSLTEVRHAA